MKSYVVVITDKKYRGGSHELTCEVYRIKRNNPDYLGFFQADTASYKGVKSEVLSFLRVKKEITKKQLGDGYYLRPKEGISIHAIGDY